MALTRYNPDASCDQNFGQAAVVSTVFTSTDTNLNGTILITKSQALASAVQIDGKIIVGGSWVNNKTGYEIQYFALARFNGTPVDLRKTYLPLTLH